MKTFDPHDEPPQDGEVRALVQSLTLAQKEQLADWLNQRERQVLERRKAELEIEALRRPLWKRAAFYNFCTAAATCAITLGVTLGSGAYDARKAELEAVNARLEAQRIKLDTDINSREDTARGLQMKVSQLESELGRLTKELETAQDQATAARKESGILNERRSVLEVEVTAARRAAESLNQQISVLEKDRVKLDEELKRAADDKKLLAREKEALASDVSSTRSRLEDSLKHAASLQKQLAVLAGELRNIEKLGAADQIALIRRVIPRLHQIADVELKSIQNALEGTLETAPTDQQPEREIQSPQPIKDIAVQNGDSNLVKPTPVRGLRLD